MPSLILSNPLGTDDAQEIGLAPREYAVGEVITVDDYVFATLIRTGYGTVYGTTEDILLIGDGDPTADTGIDGQWYLDRLNEVLWGPKVGGYWPADPIRPDRGVQQLRLDENHHLILTYSSGTVRDLGDVKGDDGVKGDTGTFEIGAVATVAPGQPARVENVGTPEHGILEFDLPQGVKGDQGTAGEGYGGGLVTAGGDPANPLNAVITSNWGLRDDGSTYYDPDGALPAEAALLMPDADVGGFALFRPGGPIVTLTADRVRDIVLNPDGPILAELDTRYSGGGGGADTTYVDQKVATEATARADADDLRQLLSEKGVANGYAGLGADGKVPAAQLPPIPDGGGGSADAGAGYMAVEAPVAPATDPLAITIVSKWGITDAGVIYYDDVGAPEAEAGILIPDPETGSVAVWRPGAPWIGTTVYSRDRGSGTVLPTTDQRRGDLYWHTDLFSLMRWTGTAWRQDGIAAVPNDAAMRAISAGYAAALHRGFQVWDLATDRQWEWSGAFWRITAGLPNVSAWTSNSLSVSAVSGTWTQIPLDSERGDAWGAFDIATGIFTVPLTGSYRISGSTGWAGNATGQRGACVYTRTDATGAWGQLTNSYAMVGAGGTQGAAVTTPLVIASYTAGSQLTLYGFQNSGAALAAPGTIRSGLTIELVEQTA